MCTENAAKNNPNTPQQKLLNLLDQAKDLEYMYRTRAIITCGLYIFYPIFHCGLYCRDVNITDNLCTKQGNSLIFGPKICGL